MPRKCSICTHDEAEAINRALVGNGTSLRTIADRYGTSKTSLIRHRDNHLPAKLTKAKEAEEVAEADDLLSQMEDLQRRTLNVLTEAENDGEPRVALRAIAEARRNVELLAEMAGELQRKGTVHVEVDQLQAVVLDALDGRPEAKADVARALYESDSNE